MNIVTYATKVLGKHIFEHEVKILQQYEERFGDQIVFSQFIRPKDVEKQYILNIFIQYMKDVRGIDIRFRHFDMTDWRFAK